MVEFKKKLIELCNESKLPVEALMFVIKDLYRDIEETFDEYNKQKEQQAKQENIETEQSEE